MQILNFVKIRIWNNGSNIPLNKKIKIKRKKRYGSKSCRNSRLNDKENNKKERSVI